MTERVLLLNAAVAILLGCLAWQGRGLARRGGRSGLVLYTLGVLLPFVDFALFPLLTSDRVAALSHPPWVAAPLYGLALILAAAVLTAFVVSTRAARRVALCMAAGYATHVALAVLTPAGWPLLAPFSAGRVSLPILPQGHLLLLGLLLVTVPLAEAVPRLRRTIGAVAMVLVAAYGLAGALQWGAITWRVQAWNTTDMRVSVLPQGQLLTHWLVVVEGPQDYALRRLPRFDAPMPEPTVLPRWNDEPLFLKLLGDPVVSRYYFRVFHYPVVRLDVSGSQVTLLMQEARDQSPLVPGPTFYLESDLSGRNRLYQLQRFN